MIMLTVFNAPINIRYASRDVSFVIKEEKTAACEGPSEGRKEKKEPVISELNVVLESIFALSGGKEIVCG